MCSSELPGFLLWNWTHLHLKLQPKVFVLICFCSFCFFSFERESQSVVPEAGAVAAVGRELIEYRDNQCRFVLGSRFHFHSQVSSWQKKIVLLKSSIDFGKNSETRCGKSASVPGDREIFFFCSIVRKTKLEEMSCFSKKKWHKEKKMFVDFRMLICSLFFC